MNATRFWSKVDRSGGSDVCWPWRASRNPAGYGRISVGGRNGTIMLAHRVAFLLAGGVLTEEEPQVLHRCDTPPCCNPMHLFRGTPAVNAADREAKGRGRAAHGDRNGARTHPERLARGERHGAHTQPERVARGERNGNAKLTERQVREIRERCAGGEMQIAVARDFGIVGSTVNRIVRKKRWQQVT